MILVATFAAGCSKPNPAAPPRGDVSYLVGTWSGDGVTVTVHDDYTWRGSRMMAWPCGGSTCASSVVVAGMVHLGSQYSIGGSAPDPAGNQGFIGGTWSSDLRTLSGRVEVSGPSGGATAYFTAGKVGATAARR